MARKLPRLQRALDAPTLASVAYGEIASSIYFALGIIALHALGHGFEDSTLRKAVEGWEGFMVEDGDRLRPEACQSPVWDTALAVLALRACGVSSEHPQLAAAGAYLLREEVTVKGDWAIRRPDLAPGGWAFEFENDLYPDVDDTAVVAMAVRILAIT